MKIYDMHIHIGEGEVNQSYLLEQMEKSGVWGGGIISDYPDTEKGVVKGVPYKDRMKKVMDYKKDKEGRIFSYLWVHPFEKNAKEIVRDAAESGIDAFKMICDTYAVYDKESMELLGEIEKTGKRIDEMMKKLNLKVESWIFYFGNIDNDLKPKIEDIQNIVGDNSKFLIESTAYILHK